MKHTWKKAAAFVLATALVAGVAPANVGTGGLFGNTAIVASAAASGSNGGFNWTLDDDGIMTVTGSGDLPDRFINQNNSITSLTFDESCQITTLKNECIYWGNNITNIVINSTVPLSVEESAIRYQNGGGSSPISITINAPKVTIADESPFFAYGRQLNITVNTDELIVYSGTMSYLGQRNGNNSFAYPANSNVYTPAGYVFNSSYMQEEYNEMAQNGIEDEFWDMYGSDLIEGVDYTYNAEASSVPLTSENAGSVFGGAQTSSSSAYTTAVTGIALDKTTAQTVTVGDKVAFTATIAPDDATDKTVKWSASNTNVKLYSDEACTTEVGTDATSTLTVYAKGMSAGNATVTVTSNADATKTATCDVTVNDTPIVAWLKSTCTVEHQSGIKLSSAAYTVADAAIQNNGTVTAALRGFKADGTTSDGLMLAAGTSGTETVGQAINALKVAGVAYIVTEEEYQAYLTTLITGKQYKQTAEKDGKFYTRFVFVKANTDFAGKNAAVFTITDTRKNEGEEGYTHTFTSQYYYTAMTTNNITYTPDSENSALFVVTVCSSSNISDKLTCSLDFT